MKQLAFDSILTEGCGKLRFYCGYSFGAHTVEDYTHAIVSTPRWITRALRESQLPIVLDNGAFPAWRDGVDLSLSDQLETMSDALTAIGPRLLWAVLPDVVEDARESFRRSTVGLSSLDVPRIKMLVPVQEGAPFAEYVAFVEANKVGGVFIGGGSKRFKLEALKALAGKVPWVHIARISADHELHWAAYYGADSFDSGAPTYGFTDHQTSGRQRDWSSSFGRYCEATNAD